MTASKIPAFRVERWMDAHETEAKYNLAETCSASISVQELQALSENPSMHMLKLDIKLTYGSIRGSRSLRAHLASLYSAKWQHPLPAENILVTAGAINANFLTFYTLLSKGDHVICHYPTYQQLYSVPASLGAEVSLWKTNPEQQWKPDLERLKSLIKPNTKMIIINNPQNPSGAIISKPLLLEIAELVNEHNLILMADEVYRPLFHSITPMHADFPPSALSLPCRRVIATGSMSKAFSLAGIRVGWLASRDSEVIEALAGARHYTNISVSQIDDQIATFALDPYCVNALLSRNIQLTKTNLAILTAFVDAHSHMCSWVKPRAGTTAFLRFSRDGSLVDDVVFCETLLRDTGVLLVPGNECFAEENEWKGYVRVGYGCETEVLQAGLELLKTFLTNSFPSIPVVN